MSNQNKKIYEIDKGSGREERKDFVERKKKKRDAAMRDFGQ
jgi:hypothetical protein